jgi:hypothetical protein
MRETFDLNEGFVSWPAFYLRSTCDLHSLTTPPSASSSMARRYLSKSTGLKAAHDFLRPKSVQMCVPTE